MNKQFFYFFFSLTFFFKVTAQKEMDSLLFNINFKWKSELLELNKNYISNNDTLQLSTLKFYISGIEINFTDGTSYKKKNSYHLIDIENFKPFPISKNEKKSIAKVSFNIGVDSLASVSGAMSGDLDPVNGMYWAWQSGYINMKIEGNSNSCKTRKNAFHFHIGGYLEPNYAMRNIKIPIKESQNNGINLTLDLAQFFSEINLSENNSIMIPGKEAMNLADLTTKIFSIE